VSRDLEDFLDAHGAKSNREWSFLGNWLLQHAILDLQHFSLSISKKATFPLKNKRFLMNILKKTKNTKQYFNQTLLKIFELIRTEAQRLKISFPPRGLTEIYYYDIHRINFSRKICMKKK